MRNATAGVVLISALVSLGCNSVAEQRERADLEAAQDAFVRAPTAGTRLQADEQKASPEIVIRSNDSTSTREKYLRRLQTKLVDLDLDIAKLASRARMERPEVRKHSERVLGDIRTKRARLASDVRALSPTAAEEWDGSRILVEREWIEVSELVSRAFVNADLRVQSN
jgi:AraC-like DNA-binding protein